MSGDQQELETLRDALKQGVAEHLRHHPLLPEWAQSGSDALDALARRLADQAAREIALREQLGDIYEAAFRQHNDWMHFHELAMDEPFKAESEAQGFAARIAAFAADSLAALAPPGQEAKVQT